MRWAKPICDLVDARKRFEAIVIPVAAAHPEVLRPGCAVDLAAHKTAVTASASGDVPKYSTHLGPQS